MFYACLAVLVLFGIMCFCVTIAIIDLEAYNFGLYIVLLCIVGTMLACALCIANPNACQNPAWYSNFCLMLQVSLNENVTQTCQEMYPQPDGTSSPKMTGLRSRMMAMQAASATQHSTTEDGKAPLRNESRATVAMLAPAVHIMHQVWKGMAWVADGIDEEEDPTRSFDGAEQGQSTSDTQSDAMVMKRLSTVIEHDHEEISSEFASCHDIMV